jgi:hypothetical protein
LGVTFDGTGKIKAEESADVFNKVENLLKGPLIPKVKEAPYPYPSPLPLGERDGVRGSFGIGILKLFVSCSS